MNSGIQQVNLFSGPPGPGSNKTGCQTTSPSSVDEFRNSAGEPNRNPPTFHFLAIHFFFLIQNGFKSEILEGTVSVQLANSGIQQVNWGKEPTFFTLFHLLNSGIRQVNLFEGPSGPGPAGISPSEFRNSSSEPVLGPFWAGAG